MFGHTTNGVKLATENSDTNNGVKSEKNKSGHTSIENNKNGVKSETNRSGHTSIQNDYYGVKSATIQMFGHTSQGVKSETANLIGHTSNARNLISTRLATSNE
jgi:hypothetical protein